jgi:RNA polymerase primary sigma factor
MAIASLARRKSPTTQSRTAQSLPTKSRAARRKNLALIQEIKTLLGLELSLVTNKAFQSRRDMYAAGLPPLLTKIEEQSSSAQPASVTLPPHLARMCATPLLTPEEEQQLFCRMNYLKYRAQKLRSQLSEETSTAAEVAEVRDLIARAERIRNYLIEANTRLVMSIARKFADDRNSFDDLLSQGLASLMHAVEKFDFDRGYRFSTYATCAVRRDLYRMVMGSKKNRQRFTTGTGELLDGCPQQEPDEPRIGEENLRLLESSVQQMLGQLDERERRIVEARFGMVKTGAKASYSRLGKELGISKERVRQLANRAFAQLRGLAEELRLETLLA